MNALFIDVHERSSMVGSHRRGRCAGLCAYRARQAACGCRSHSDTRMLPAPNHSHYVGLRLGGVEI